MPQMNQVGSSHVKKEDYRSRRADQLRVVLAKVVYQLGIELEPSAISNSSKNPTIGINFDVDPDVDYPRTSLFNVTNMGSSQIIDAISKGHLKAVKVEATRLRNQNFLESIVATKRKRSPRSESPDDSMNDAELLEMTNPVTSRTSSPEEHHDSDVSPREQKHIHNSDYYSPKRLTTLQIPESCIIRTTVYRKLLDEKNRLFASNKRLLRDLEAVGRETSEGPEINDGDLKVENERLKTELGKLALELYRIKYDKNALVNTDT